MNAEDIKSARELCEKLAAGRVYRTVGGGPTQYAVRTLLPKALDALDETRREIERLEIVALAEGGFRCCNCARVFDGSAYYFSALQENVDLCQGCYEKAMLALGDSRE